ncbi:MAG: sigma 54-interacting transcriptional regulator [Fervidobacterium sp.]|uniref:Sigma-54 interaction domain-containing protein n=1 Tax=Fervidobacterium gondwanense DSM 13020 TaxID=1121883 RepID=A0A1M7TF83_FERGO|nr:sigma 54-interacting transcriptional regulator [Fervidobacterium gondwanense]SHN69313.1 Sigma-54 interaction domain-containing protein [Fervidobacterium gondwanense DSM 13020]
MSAGRSEGSKLKVCFVVDDELESIVKNVVNRLGVQFKAKGEKVNLVNIIKRSELKNPKEIENKKVIWIVTGNSFDNKVGNSGNDMYILIIDRALDIDLIKKFLTHDVVGVFRRERLEGEGLEYEELGKFEKLLKDLLRETDENIIVEEDTMYEMIRAKDIENWKFVVKREEIAEKYEDIKYISVFLDPSMREFSKKLKTIIADFKKSYETMTKFVRDKKYRNTPRMESHEKLQDISKKFIEFFSKNRYFKVPSLLLEGETGTGKSLIAEIIAREVLGEHHFKEEYYRQSLVNVEKQLIDSILFGTEKGAFTDSVTKLGRITVSCPGILFLDEITEVPPDVQAKLLTYMDDSVVHPVGYTGAEKIYAPTHIIAATNKDLKKEIQEGSFRADLYYRFKYRLTIPPLRERVEDIRFLINFVLLNPNVNPFDKEEGYKIKKISLNAIKKLEKRKYAGNFREFEDVLRNAVQQALYEGLNIILERHVQ